MDEAVNIFSEYRKKLESEITESGRQYIRSLQRRFIMEDLSKKRKSKITKLWIKEI